MALNPNILAIFAENLSLTKRMTTTFNDRLYKFRLESLSKQDNKVQFGSLLHLITCFAKTYPAFGYLRHRYFGGNGCNLFIVNSLPKLVL